MEGEERKDKREGKWRGRKDRCETEMDGGRAGIRDGKRQDG